MRWGPTELRTRLAAAMSIYAEAMGYPPETAEQRTGYTAAHTTLDGFQAVAALGERDALVGFGYGYLIAPGQWWHDQVNMAMPPGRAHRWLPDSFELCELHVRPAHQGRGIGRSLLLTLAEGVPQSRMLLSTPEGDTRAWRLYRSLGFVDLVRHYRFPGDNRPFAVLGAPLPFGPAGA
ncbi:MAG TPA: N-acetyltransferase [Mycobacteriales bacterium]|nr:N-acetyltransferase [Mycobacteriales bacterium]